MAFLRLHRPPPQRRLSLSELLLWLRHRRPLLVAFLRLRRPPPQLLPHRSRLPPRPYRHWPRPHSFLVHRWVSSRKPLQVLLPPRRLSLLPVVPLLRRVHPGALSCHSLRRRALRLNLGTVAFLHLAITIIYLAIIIIIFMARPPGTDTAHSTPRSTIRRSHTMRISRSTTRSSTPCSTKVSPRLTSLWAPSATLPRSLPSHFPGCQALRLLLGPLRCPRMGVSRVRCGLYCLGLRQSFAVVRRSLRFR